MIMDTGRWDILTAFAVLVKCLFLPGSHAAYCPQKSRPERRCGRNSGCCQQGKGEEAVEENVHIKIPERAEQIIDAIVQADEEMICAIQYGDREGLEDVLKDYLY